MNVKEIKTIVSCTCGCSALVFIGCYSQGTEVFWPALNTQILINNCYLKDTLFIFSSRSAQVHINYSSSRLDYVLSLYLFKPPTWTDLNTGNVWERSASWRKFLLKCFKLNERKFQKDEFIRVTLKILQGNYI